MKAIVYTKYGSPDVLQLTDVEKPRPQNDEVLVKVVATAVNQADNHVLSGMLRYSTGLFKPKQQILGSDIAGQVEAVGVNVAGVILNKFDGRNSNIRAYSVYGYDGTYGYAPELSSVPTS